MSPWRAGLGSVPLPLLGRCLGQGWDRRPRLWKAECLGQVCSSRSGRLGPTLGSAVAWDEALKGLEALGLSGENVCGCAHWGTVLELCGDNSRAAAVGPSQSFLPRRESVALANVPGSQPGSAAWQELRRRQFEALSSLGLPGFLAPREGEH